MTPFEQVAFDRGGRRQAWVQPAVTSSSARCCIFLDGELYLQRVQAAEVVSALQQQGELLDIACLYVAATDGAARHRDFPCNEEYASLLVEELLPWMERILGAQREVYLCGLSLSGLASAYTLWKYPRAFTGGLFQSPSAWWNEEWLTSAIAHELAALPRCWISVGTQELGTDVRHPPTGMHQQTSQLDSVRRLAAAWQQTGARAHLNEFAGGHDPACWKAELPEALRWLMS